MLRSHLPILTFLLVHCARPCFAQTIAPEHLFDNTCSIVDGNWLDSHPESQRWISQTEQSIRATIGHEFFPRRPVECFFYLQKNGSVLQQVPLAAFQTTDKELLLQAVVKASPFERTPKDLQMHKFWVRFYPATNKTELVLGPVTRDRLLKARLE